MIFTVLLPKHVCLHLLKFLLSLYNKDILVERTQAQHQCEKELTLGSLLHVTSEMDHVVVQFKDVVDF